MQETLISNVRSWETLRPSNAVYPWNILTFQHLINKNKHSLVSVLKESSNNFWSKHWVLNNNFLSCIHFEPGSHQTMSNFLLIFLFPCNMAAERSWSLAFTCFGARLLCFNFSTTDFPLADHSSTRASIWRQCELQNRKDNKSDANLNSKLWLSQRGPQVLLVQKIYCVCYIKYVFAFHISR